MSCQTFCCPDPATHRLKRNQPCRTSLSHTISAFVGAMGGLNLAAMSRASLDPMQKA